MTTVVIDPYASLADRLDDDIVYSRNASHALMLLHARRASRRKIDTLWLSWDLSRGQGPGEGEDASRIVSMLAESARAGRPFPINRIIVVTHNAERRHQAISALRLWYAVDALSPRDAALHSPRGHARLLDHLAPIERLKRAGVQIEPGLSDEEIEVVQKRFGIAFSVPHRSLLQVGLPVDLSAQTVRQRPRWPDWRHGDQRELETWIRRAPAAADAAAAAPALAGPPLIPLCDHRYLPSGGHLKTCWVFSAHELDVIYYGNDIGAWIGREFEGDSWSPERPASEDRIPYWSDLAERLR
ncbi:hypothetical protein [Nocardioides sp. Soil774]|uniref:hypothetical protein n=1 Tax=Nocardioides sp. Soil774 TaxID=1736408 RepID=UPI000ABADDE4|nr:hypothetical protein [Nocardioides sp. Soil774]